MGSGQWARDNGFWIKGSGQWVWERVLGLVDSGKSANISGAASARQQAIEIPTETNALCGLNYLNKPIYLGRTNRFASLPESL